MPATPVYFAPDIDTSWEANPGALGSMTAFAPLQSGYYGTIGCATYLPLEVTGSDILACYMFRKVDGTVRLLVFRSTNIDEYDSAATRTNRVTGLTSATEWNAAAWGDQIIAVNLSNSTQSSTGAGFSALSGAPKARHIAANLDFVMLADTDDGVTAYKDEVYWSAIRNPNSWTTSLTSQCGRIRLLDAPGPITALIAFRDQFVAFKDNAVFVGDYVGPQQFIFQWRCISQKVGCVGPKAVCEMDGKLYFMHTSGFYEFDGQMLRNVGLPVFQSFMSEAGFATSSTSDVPAPNEGTYSLAPTKYVEAGQDEIEGVVWFKHWYGIHNGLNNTDTLTMFMYGYNPRSGKWGRHKVPSTGDIATRNIGASQTICRASQSDIQTFLRASTAKFLMVWNNDGHSTLRKFSYPSATTDLSPAAYSTGIFGAYDRSVFTGSVYLRHTAGSDAIDAAAITGTLTGYKEEAKLTALSTKTMVNNTELQTLDGTMDARFKTVSVAYLLGGKFVLGGLAPQFQGSGKR